MFLLLHRLRECNIKIVVALLTPFILLLAKRYVYVDTHIEAMHPCPTHGWVDKPNQVVWDAVPINSELDILDARIHELNEVVDHFVVVEAPYTFSGKRKPLYFNENKERFAEFAHKIKHIIVEDFVPPPGVTNLQV